MGFRVLIIENEASLRLKLNNLIINKVDEEIWIPLDDISMIVVDNLRISITFRMLTMLAEKNIGLVTCDLKHHPIGYYGAYNNHSRSSKVLSYQINRLETDFYDELWKKIVYWKIDNQIKVLQLLNMDNEMINKMEDMLEKIENGDKTNREAHAAKIYFNTMMNSTFSRGNDNILLNSALDYGYAIIRSYIAKLCIGYGLNTQIGIHHKNEYNRFNLVDDLMEPIRPILDIFAYYLMNGEEFFKPYHRHELVNFLNHKIKYKNKKMFLCNMLEDYIEQIASYIMGKEIDITWPDVRNYDIDLSGMVKEDEI